MEETTEQLMLLRTAFALLSQAGEHSIAGSVSSRIVELENRKAMELGQLVTQLIGKVI